MSPNASVVVSSGIGVGRVVRARVIHVGSASVVISSVLGDKVCGIVVFGACTVVARVVGGGVVVAI